MSKPSVQIGVYTSMHIFELSFFIHFFTVIVLTVGMALVGLFISIKFLKMPSLKAEEIRIGATICTLIGGLFGLILALMVITLWQDYKIMHTKTIEEAAYLDIVYRESNHLQHPHNREFQKMLENYISIIINDSWPKMTKGIESTVSLAAYDEMFNYILFLKIEEKNGGGENLKKSMLEHLNALAVYRKERWHYASSPRVPSIIWLILIMGTIISISSTYFFRIGTFKTQAILTTMHSGMIGIILFLIMSLNYPFRGPIRIDPTPFEKTLDFIKKGNIK